MNTSHFSFPKHILMAAKDKMLHSEGHSASAHSSRHRTHRNCTALRTWPSLVNKTWRPAMTRRLRHKTLSTHRATDGGRRTVEREGQGKVVNVVKTRSRRPDFLADACTHHEDWRVQDVQEKPIPDWPGEVLQFRLDVAPTNQK